MSTSAIEQGFEGKQRERRRKKQKAGQTKEKERLSGELGI